MCPTYNMNCDTCKNTIEVKWTFAEHDLMKNNTICETCGEKRYQSVAPLNFRLAGECWHSRGAGNNSTGLGYTMTDNELKANIEQSAKIEDITGNMSEKFYSENQ